jgi:rubrerythrin
VILGFVVFVVGSLLDRIDFLEESITKCPKCGVMHDSESKKCPCCQSVNASYLE